MEQQLDLNWIQGTGALGLVGLDLMVRAWVALVKSWGVGFDWDLEKKLFLGLHRRRCSFTSRRV